MQNKNILMICNLKKENLNYWKGLNFPIVNRSDAFSIIDSNWTKFEIEKFEHGSISYLIHKDKYKPICIYDSCNAYTFFINSKDKLIVEEFELQLKEYFQNFQNAQNGYGWYFNKDIYLDEIQYSDNIQKELTNSIEFRNLFQLPDNLLAKDVNEFYSNKLKEVIKNYENDKNDIIFEKMFIATEDIVRNRYDEIQTELFWDSLNKWDTNFCHLEDLINKNVQENLNINNKI